MAALPRTLLVDRLGDLLLGVLGVVVAPAVHQVRLQPELLDRLLDLGRRDADLLADLARAEHPVRLLGHGRSLRNRGRVFGYDTHPCHGGRMRNPLILMGFIHA